MRAQLSQRQHELNQREALLRQRESHIETIVESAVQRERSKYERVLDRIKTREAETHNEIRKALQLSTVIAEREEALQRVRYELEHTKVTLLCLVTATKKVQAKLTAAEQHLSSCNANNVILHEKLLHYADYETLKKENARLQQMLDKAQAVNARDELVAEANKRAQEAETTFEQINNGFKARQLEWRATLKEKV